MIIRPYNVFGQSQDYKEKTEGTLSNNVPFLPEIIKRAMKNKDLTDYGRHFYLTFTEDLAYITAKILIHHDFCEKHIFDVITDPDEVSESHIIKFVLNYLKSTSKVQEKHPEQSSRYPTEIRQQMAILLKELHYSCQNTMESLSRVTDFFKTAFDCINKVKNAQQTQQTQQTDKK
jgi:hypothetical protein